MCEHERARACLCNTVYQQPHASCARGPRQATHAEGRCAQRLGLAGWQREGGSPIFLHSPPRTPARTPVTPWPSSKPQRSQGRYLVKTVVQCPPMLLGRGRLAAGCDSRPSAHHSQGVLISLPSKFLQTFVRLFNSWSKKTWAMTHFPGAALFSAVERSHSILLARRHRCVASPRVAFGCD
jgi:hypothetical protein